MAGRDPEAGYQGGFGLFIVPPTLLMAIRRIWSPTRGTGRELTASTPSRPVSRWQERGSIEQRNTPPASAARNSASASSASQETLELAPLPCWAHLSPRSVPGADRRTRRNDRRRDCRAASSHRNRAARLGRDPAAESALSTRHDQEGGARSSSPCRQQAGPRRFLAGCRPCGSATWSQVPGSDPGALLMRSQCLALLDLGGTFSEPSPKTFPSSCQPPPTKSEPTTQARGPARLNPSLKETACGEPRLSNLSLLSTGIRSPDS